MVTIFTTAKPFRGHVNVIQRNALHSWRLLHPDVQIILFGDDEGAAQVCAEIGVHHEPTIEKTEAGSVRIDSMFSRAQALSSYDVLCYLNCDIILTSDFLVALKRVYSACPNFLMIGRRWDTPVTGPIDFSDSRWEQQTRTFALSTNKQRDEWWIDYFAFSRGLFGSDIPALAVGRPRWDNWTVWCAISSGNPVVDASSAVVAVHQNHDYSYFPHGVQGIFRSDEAKRNLELAGGWDHLRTIADATHRLSAKGVSRNPKRFWVSFKRRIAPLYQFLLYRCWVPVRIFLLDITRSLRHKIGLRQRKQPGDSAKL
jgi:hypothetical protein